MAEEEEEEDEDEEDNTYAAYDYEENGRSGYEDGYSLPDGNGAEEKRNEKKTEAITTTSTATTPGRSREEEPVEEDELVTPRVSPVAVSPPYSPKEYDDENIDDDFPSGSGASATDDEDEDRESAETEDYDDEDPIDFTSITGNISFAFSSFLSVLSFLFFPFLSWWHWINELIYAVVGETDPTDTHVIDDVDEESDSKVVVPTPAPSTEAPPHQPDFAAPPQQPETPVVDTPVDGTLPKHNVEENPTHTTDRGMHPVDVSGGVAKTGDRQTSFFAQPGILAG